MPIVASLLVAGAFYLFLLFLAKYQERFFEKGEIALGFLLGLTVGWPNFIVFLPLVFIAVIFVSILRLIFLKEAYTTLGAPLLLAAFTAILFGDYFINLLGLAAFRI